MLKLVRKLGYGLAVVAGFHAHAFPQLTTHGYNCTSCHVSPHGGGLLNEYGRNQSENILSRWSYENEGRLLHGINLPEYINLGGDFRWINVTRKHPLGDHSKIFWMQNELEAAIKPIKGLTIVATVGKYSEDDEFEYRRNYLLLDINNYVSFRVGRFIPGYGLLTADHTVYTHPGEGSEQYQIEANLQTQFFNLTFAKLYGASRNIRATSSDGYKLERDKDGFLAKASVFVFGSNTFGYSYQRFLYDKQGPYLILDLSPAYLLAQYDVANEKESVFSEFGYEVGRGVITALGYQYKTEPSSHKIEAKVNFYPRPHWEFGFQYDRELVKEVALDQYLFLGHYWL